MASMDALIKACTKPHAVAHLVSGAGIGLILVGLVPALEVNALILGIIVLVAGMAYDFMVNKG